MVINRALDKSEVEVVTKESNFVLVDEIIIKIAGTMPMWRETNMVTRTRTTMRMVINISK